MSCSIYVACFRAESIWKGLIKQKKIIKKIKRDQMSQLFFKYKSIKPFQFYDQNKFPFYVYYKFKSSINKFFSFINFINMPFFSGVLYLFKFVLLIALTKVSYQLQGFPTIDSLHSQVSTSYYSTYSNISDFTLTKYYFLRFSSTKRLDLWYIYDDRYTYYLKSSSSLALGQKLLFYDMQHYEYSRITVLTQNFSLITYDIGYYYLTRIKYVKLPTLKLYCGIQVSNSQVLLLEYVNQTNFIYRYSRDSMVKIDKFDTLYGYKISEMKTCRPKSSSLYFYLVLRVKQCDFLIYNCSSVSCSLLYKYVTLNSTTCTNSYRNSSQSIRQHKLSVNYNCQKFLFRTKSNQIKVYDIISNTFTSKISLGTGSTVVLSQFYDKYSTYAMVTTSSPSKKVLIFDILSQNASQVNSASISSLQTFVTYHMSRSMIYTASNSKIYSRSLTCNQYSSYPYYGMCYDCQVSHCKGCNNYQICHQCSSKYINNLTSCYYDTFGIYTNNTDDSDDDQTMPLSVNSNNSQLNSSDASNSSLNSTDLQNSTDLSNSTDSQNLTVSNSTAQNSTDLFNSTAQNSTDLSNSSDWLDSSSNSSNYTNLSSFQNSSNLGNSENINQTYNQNLQNLNEQNPYAASVISMIGDVASYVTLVLQMTPFAGFFIRFLNYWTICSFYLFLNIDLPLYLETSLLTIYSSINKSLLAMLGFDLQFDFQIQEKFSSQFAENFGTTSNFLKENFQNISIICVSYLILLGLFFVKEKLKQNKMQNTLFKILDFNYGLAFFGQFLSIMNCFILIFPIIKEKSYQLSWVEKINISVHLIFLFLAFTSSFILFVLMQPQINPENSLTKVEIRLQNKKKSLFRMDWMYQTLCNVIIPFTAINALIWPFLLINGIFYSFNMHKAFQEIQFRINSIILSFYIMIFHISFCGVIFTPFPQLFGNICAFVLLFGAFHQSLTLICGIFYPIFKGVKNHLTKVQNQKNQTINNKTNNIANNKIKNIFQIQTSKSCEDNQFPHPKKENKKLVKKFVLKTKYAFKMPINQQTIAEKLIFRKKTLSEQFISKLTGQYQSKNSKTQQQAQIHTQIEQKGKQKKGNQSKLIKFKLRKVKTGTNTQMSQVNNSHSQPQISELSFQSPDYRFEFKK